ncbi:adhesion G protein-coupled receptor L4-like [Macrobrachium nipponense]|uniref:adhesion G protein-coupled receptor L4-like n=1 Tax=Macrobrachium nipponense TaxID=159736 RepID=UPI0030C7EFB9
MMTALPLLAILTCFPRIDCSSNLPSYLRNKGSQDDDSAEYLINSVVKGDFKEVLRLVQSNSSFANAQDSEKTALTYAVQKEDVRMVRLLLQYGANTNSFVEVPLAAPPSFWAVETNNTEILKLLLEYCSDPSVQHEFERGETRSLREAAELKQNLKMVELIDEYMQHGCGRCPAERRLFAPLNINWFLPETASRNIANISCPVSYGYTFGTWRCGTNSTWDEAPDLSPCRNIESLIKTPGETSVPTTAAENLAKMADSINSITLLPGDLLAIDDAVKTLQTQHINHDLLQFEPEAPTLTKKYLKALVNVTGKMLDDPSMWTAMPSEQAKTAVTDLQENVVKGALTAAKYLSDNATDDYPNNNLHVRVSHQPPGYYTADQNRHYQHLVFPKTHLQLPERFFHKYNAGNLQGTTNSKPATTTPSTSSAADNEDPALITVIFSSYRDLHCISNTVPCQPPGDENDTIIEGRSQVNSGVIGAKVGFGQTWKAEDNDVVEVTFNHIYDGGTYLLKNPQCVWWDTEDNSWSSQGCQLYDFKPSYTVCHCTHLTNLAVIMDINGLIDKETVLYQMLQWITVIGCSISIVSLAVCIACFFFLKKVKTKKSSSIRGNLCLCLLFAEVVLLLGLNETKRKSVCKLVAALLHYFFLATFTWSAIEAFNLYLALVKVFQTQTSLRKHYLVAGYCIPLLFVGVTLVITKGEGYGTDKMCWLEPHRPIWIFAGSLAFIILMNLISFAMTMRVAWRERPTVKGKSVSQKSSSQLTKRLSGSTAIFLLLGLTWVTGFFYMAEGTQMLALLFTVLNSLQGFGIFVFGILFDDNIRKEAKEVIEHQLETKVSSSFKGSFNPQRRGSYNFNTESEEISRMDTVVKAGGGEEEDKVSTDQDGDLEDKTKL